MNDELAMLMNLLDDRGVRFERRGDRLRVESREPLPAELLAEVRAHRDEVLEILQRPDQMTRTPEAAHQEAESNFIARHGMSSKEWWRRYREEVTGVRTSAPRSGMNSAK